MTKPAAVFAQLSGAILAFFALGAFSDNNGTAGTMMLGAGVALFVLGGLATRKRIRSE